MRAELKRLHRQFGMTIVYATPDELEALSMGEEIAVMRDGAVVQRGTPDELYETPARHLCRGQDRLAAHEHAEGDRLGRWANRIDTPLGKLPAPHKLKRANAGEQALARHPAERHPPGGQGRARASPPRCICSSRWATSRSSRSKPAGRRCAWCLPEARRQRHEAGATGHDLIRPRARSTSSAPRAAR